MTDYKSLVKQIANQQFQNVYLLDGEEPYYIDMLVRKFEEAIPEEERDFNLITFYGKDANWREVVNAARGFPMFGERLMVILKDASNMKDLPELISYIEQPMPSTVLVIEHRFKKLDSRGKLKKRIEKKGAHFYSEKIKENHVSEWIMNFCADHHVKIAAKEAEKIATYLGNDLQKIVNEINKILINQTDLREISAELIEKYIGISKEYSVFEFPDILFEGNSEKLSRILNYFEGNPNSAPMPMVLATFFNFFKGIYLSYHSKENFQEDRKLGIWSKHRRIAKTLPETTIHQFFALLEEYSHKSVGIENNNKDKTLLREMTGKMKYLLENQLVNS